MRINLEGKLIPYPLDVLFGKLRLVGLSKEDSHEVFLKIKNELFNLDEVPTESRIFEIMETLLEINHQDSVKKFQTLLKYEQLRRTDAIIPPIILILAGASATGKSMLAIRMIENLSSTRMTSTDTLRQILRDIMSQTMYPELFCHTYQAHQYRLSGDEDLDVIVQGYIAQCELMQPTVVKAIARISDEGANAIIEGVHILPGVIAPSFHPGVIEIIINPNLEDHKSMFMTKHSAGALRTVSSDEATREHEFIAARKIQDYILTEAKRNNVRIVELSDYSNAEDEICRIVIETIFQILREHEIS